MCGRYGITIDPQRSARVLRAQYDEHGDLHVPNWNAAPTQRLPIDDGERALVNIVATRGLPIITHQES